ncbi:MAG: domain containing protein [Verrucomicrobiales bacterium]|nr:domain containing protein [Verrucomicrobiales bacterium]
MPLPMSKLVALSEGLTGRTLELKVDKTTIGRLEDNSFQIAEPSVSSHHCEVLLKGSDVVIKDLNSTNGTFINGEKITESTLKPGQILRLGNIELRLEADGAASAPAPGSPAAATAAKQKLDQTRVIPRGVKMNEFEQGPSQVKFDKNSGFAKKKDKTNMIFIVVGVVLAVIIIGIMVFAMMKVGAPAE